MPKQTELRRGGRSNDGWIVNHLQMLKLPYSSAEHYVYTENLQ